MRLPQSDPAAPPRLATSHGHRRMICQLFRPTSNARDTQTTTVNLSREPILALKTSRATKQKDQSQLSRGTSGAYPRGWQLQTGDTESSTANTVVHISAHFALSHCYTHAVYKRSSGSCPTGCGSRSHQSGWLHPPVVHSSEFVAFSFPETNDDSRIADSLWHETKGTMCTFTQHLPCWRIWSKLRPLLKTLVGADRLYYCGFFHCFAELPTAFIVSGSNS